MSQTAAVSLPAWVQALSWQPVSPDEFKKLSPSDQLTRIRHSSAHVLASAVVTIRPEVQFATGPATPQGYFYDMKTENPLKEEDLETIQLAMDKIAGRSTPFEFTTITKAKAIELFTELNQSYKLQVIERIDSDELTLYKHGEFLDLCAGPHVPHTGLCRNNKVLTLAAVHWRDEEKPSLTRVSGTAWANEKDLKRYLEFLTESKARDHRVLGPQLDMFSFHPWASAALWHPKGVTYRKLLFDLIEEKTAAQEYQEILNPLLYKKELYQTSGHWDHFQENIFIFTDQQKDSPTHGEPLFALKPMNCPDTMLYYKTNLRSYRDLPMRIAEKQILHRNEATGALHGVMRTRMFTQDDAHIFVRPDQVEAEVQNLLSLVEEIYSLFDLTFNIHLSTRPENYMGELAVWDKAESDLKAALETALKPKGRTFQLDPGEGAFYGPKVDIYIQDSLGREWQCGTVQLDFQLPERFELEYIDQDGSRKRPIVIHRAIFGSFERFMGILVEHLGGAFPTWLSPVQAVVLPISEKQTEYGETVLKALKAEGIRAELRTEESVNKRIRSAETQKVPYMLVVGDREAEANSVAVRHYTDGQTGTKPLTDLIGEIKNKVSQRTFDVTVKRFADLFQALPQSASTEDSAY